MKAETVAPRHKPLANRVVIDTNVWLSAALSPVDAPSQVVRRVLAAGVPVFSDATFAELETRIWKPKFDRYLSMQARQGILHDARALAGSALWLVTGDQDLLVIVVDLGVRIVAPAQALLKDTFCK